MPPLLPDAAVNDIVEARINYTLFGQRCMTVLHWEVTGAGTPAEDWWTLYLGLEGAITNATTGLLTKTLAQMTDEVTCDFIDIQVVRPQRLIYRRFNIGTTGDVAGSAGTANIAMSLTKRGEIPAKGNSGRIQLFGLSSSHIADGKWSPGIIGTVAADVAPYYLGVLSPSGYTLTPVFIGKSKIGVLKTNTVIDIVVQDTIRTMHRRTVHLGV